MTYRIGSICSGVDGLGLGVTSVIPDSRIVWQVENDKYASEVLDTRFPNTPNFGDLKTIQWSRVKPVHLLIAGYPCQPFSQAGLRKGTDDPRHLFPYIAKAIRDLRPRHVFLENVAGHLTKGFDTVLGTLASLGYDARWTCLRASDVGACHRRERLFILATDAGRPGAGWDSSSVPGATQEPRRPLGQLSAPVDGGADPRLLPTPSAWLGRRPNHGVGDSARWLNKERSRELSDFVAWRKVATEPSFWGEYAAAVTRQEAWCGPAPEPSLEGRLNPVFVEWMMGFPAGWVTDVPVSRTQQLKMLGNAVVPRQAATALRMLTDG